jgi:hypothetical protein
MARYDKYEPKAGGFRAPLAADLEATTAQGTGNPLGVGLDVNGRVVPGAGQSGIVGVLVTTKNMKAGDIVDVMTAGEVVEMAAVAAGTMATALTTTGVIDDVATDATHLPVGFTVEATRLIVRVGNTVTVEVEAAP